MDKLQHLNPIIERIEIADAALFSYAYTELSGRTQKVLAFLGAPAWEEVYFANGSSQFAEASERQPNGVLADQVVELFYPGADRPDLSRLHNRHFVLQLKYIDKEPMIIGSPENPWLAIAGFSTERKGYLVQFTRNEAK